MTRGLGGSLGPLAASRDGLRRIGLGERTLKTAFAAGLAYWLGSMVPGAESSYLSPVTAVLVMQLTIADSLTIGVQRLLGVSVGIPVALAIAGFLGVNALSVALVVMVGFGIGVSFRLSSAGVQQVAITALLVMLVATPHVGYAYTRIIETIVGGAVGILVNALLLPPSYLDKAIQVIAAHGAGVADLLSDTADALDAGFPAARSDALLQQARGTEVTAATATTILKQAMSSQRFNRRAKSQAASMVRWTAALELIRRTRIQSLGIVRTLHDLAAASPARPGSGEPLDVRASLAASLRANAEELRASLAVAASPTAANRAAFTATAARADATLARLVTIGPGADQVGEDAWVGFAAMVTDLRRMAQENRDFVASVRVDG